MRITVGIALLIAIAIFGYERPIFWAVPLTIVVLLATLIGFFLRSLRVSEASIKYHGWFGKRVTLSPQDVSRIILVGKYQEFNIGEVQRIFFIKADGTSHFSISTAYWPEESFSRLLEWGTVHSIEQARESEPMNSIMLVTKYGKALPFYERHLWATAFLIVGAIVLAYIIWFLIFELPGY